MRNSTYLQVPFKHGVLLTIKMTMPYNYQYGMSNMTGSGGESTGDLGSESSEQDRDMKLISRN